MTWFRIARLSFAGAARSIVLSPPALLLRAACFFRRRREFILVIPAGAVGPLQRDSASGTDRVRGSARMPAKVIDTGIAFLRRYGAGEIFAVRVER